MQLVTVKAKTKGNYKNSAQLLPGEQTETK